MEYRTTYYSPARAGGTKPVFDAETRRRGEKNGEEKKGEFESAEAAEGAEKQKTLRVCGGDLIGDVAAAGALGLFAVRIRPPMI